ncbi:uncharacterized protein LOC108205048 isoform X2 [Daucus carota subsp. sativus]|uniref:uncharacterized protein LOC108205048 isoform X2 n=1 Tax=Daucus carota subsp. sativus TaxID=79200 RepID=UPI003083987C
MDLNAPPIPEGNEAMYSEVFSEDSTRIEPRMTAAETNQLVADGRHPKPKRKYPYDNSMQGSHSFRKKNEGYDRYSLPSGWLDCPAYGDEVDFFIPSKVPLGDSFRERISPDKRYTPRDVIYEQRRLGRELGLVIDLTNTNRYYPESDWLDAGIKYAKIRCQGRDAVPDSDSVDRFIQEAVDKFARARPPGIYKLDYIDDLYNFYQETKPQSLVCPQTPEWKKFSDQEDNGATHLQDTVTASVNMTNDDILGDSVPSNQIEALRQFCLQALKLNVQGRGKPQFPGSHPVSLSRDNLQLLRQRYYYATWKADGTRYLMLITWDGCYLIDRNFFFRKVQLRFPCKNVNEGIDGTTHHYTLLDGEMVIDTEPSTRKQERRYLIYDLMAINNVSLVERPFHERWMILENEVIKPRNHERNMLYKSRNPYYRYDLEPFRVRRKDFYLLSAVTKLLREFIPKLSHEADGLIFQGWDDPYVPRTHEGLLKWKFPEMNSVDFLFEVENSRRLLFLNERGKKKLMNGHRVVFKDESEIYSFSGKIIECSWNPEDRVWIFMRIRVDKSTPNEFNTFKKVMRSINDNITEEVVLNEISEIVRLPMYAERISKDCRAFVRTAQRK